MAIKAEAKTVTAENAEILLPNFVIPYPSKTPGKTSSASTTDMDNNNDNIEYNLNFKKILPSYLLKII